MKRDLNLATRILTGLEAKPLNAQLRGLNGYSDDEFYYHARLLAGAGLIQIIDLNTYREPYACVATQLTWAGHDFLERARSPEWIDKAKQAGFDVGKDAAAAAVRFALTKLWEKLAPHIANLFVN